MIGSVNDSEAHSPGFSIAARNALVTFGMLENPIVNKLFLRIDGKGAITLRCDSEGCGELARDMVSASAWESFSLSLL